MSKIANCTFTTCANEQIEAAVKLPHEQRSVIFGTVLDSNGCPVKDAVVKLLQVVDGCKYPYPLTHTFTDEYGQFLLGPLCPKTKYMLKIYKDNISVRYMPLDVDCYQGPCIGCQPKHGNEKPGCNCGNEQREQSKSGCGCC